MTQTEHRYFHSGLQISSDLAIDDWDAFEAPLGSKEPDVCIRIRDSYEAREVGDYEYVVPEVGRYVIRGGAEIVVIPESGVDLQEVKAFLTSGAWGALCHQRGLPVLHGSAVRVGGRVFAFAGHSGAGKSTMVAGLAQNGYEMIVDDTSRLEVLEDRVLLYPSARRLKLWSETLQGLNCELGGLTRVYAEIDKYCVPMPGQPTPDPIRLDAIYILNWGDLGLRRLIGVDALREFLRAATYRPEVIDALGVEGKSVPNAFEVVNRVPIFEFSRPRDIDGMSAAIAVLERHWSNDFP